MPIRPSIRYSQVSCGLTNSPGLIELVHARFTRHHFQPHVHDTWSLCAVISGIKNIALPSATPILARAGDVYLLRPEQAHAGCSVDAEACEYAMLHISKQEWHRQCVLRNIDFGLTSMRPRQQRRLSSQIAAFVLGKLAQRPDQLNWDAVCDAFFAKNQPRECEPKLPDVSSSVRFARDYLRHNWSKTVSLAELSQQSSLSAFELTRRFHAAYGLPPHRYQLAVRIMHAKSYLLQGIPITEVASSTGFTDQSHFGRVFKAMLGFTPGTLTAAAKEAPGRG